MASIALSGASKCRDRIHRRPGSPNNRQRCRSEEELPSLPGGSSVAQGLEIAIIDQVNTQRHEGKVMYRSHNVRGGNVLRMIRSEDRDVLFFKPGNHGWIESC